MTIILLDDEGKEVVRTDTNRTNDMLVELLLFYVEMDKHALELIMKGVKMYARPSSTEPVLTNGKIGSVSD